MLIKQKLRRLAVVYIDWNRRWADMQGRTEHGEMRLMQDGPVQQIDFISKAPRVFPDRESLQQFLEAMSTITQSEKIRWSGAAPAHTRNVWTTPGELTDLILATPERSRGYFYFATPGVDIMTVAGAEPPAVEPGTVIPGHSSISLSVPVDWDNGNDLPIGYGSIHSVGITVINTLGENRAQIQMGLLVEALRIHTVSPSKADLRKLRGFIPLALEESRQTGAQRKWEARIQRKAVFSGAVSALVVGGGLEIVKAIFGAAGGK